MIITGPNTKVKPMDRYSFSTVVAVAILFVGSSDLFGGEVPPVLQGNFPSFVTPVPESPAVWEKRKTELRATLHELLGTWPELFTPKPTLVSKEQRDGYTLEKFTFDNGAAATVYGYLMIPDGRTEPGPAILYNHYHGGRYQQGKEEVLIKAFEFRDVGHHFVTGEELVRAGYVVICIDAYAFGERRWQGPADKDREGHDTEHDLTKMFLWQGRTLWGMMVRDDVLALNYLISRPEVDPKRIAAMGMSMGSTRSWWVTAMDERIKCCISVCCLTRYQDLMAAGLRAHGFYYWVPGILKEQIDMESVIGLIAPRPHLTLTGDQDRGSPAAGVRTINAFQEKLYHLYDQEENFRGVLYPGVGHDYTDEMWKETIVWLKKHL
ncbi:MAG: dienelactone hydrolase family protein [Pirellulaceae bacterium]|nr:dienelactone hydrolase family protein [Pirellulaceae bacterium]